MKSKIWYVAALMVCAWIGYLISQDARFSLSPERTGVALLKGGYRAWYVDCSYGVIMDGSGRHLWHKPIFVHVDLRAYITNGMSWINLSGESDGSDR